MAYTEKEVQKAKDHIIEQLSIGKSLKSILDNTDFTPSRPIIYQWLNSKHDNYDKSFFNNYTQAREDSADIDAEKIQELAEKTLAGKHDPAAARVALDAYKWSAGKKKPKKYGDKIQTEHSGEVGIKQITGFEVK